MASGTPNLPTIIPSSSPSHSTHATNSFFSGTLPMGRPIVLWCWKLGQAKPCCARLVGKLGILMHYPRLW